MITDKDYFSAQLEEINREITSYDQKINLLKKCSISDFSKENITKRFSDIFLIFPFQIESASEFLGISIYTRELFGLYYKISNYDGKIDSDIINAAKEKFNKQEIYEEDEYIINEFFDEYFHSLVYFYENVLINTMSYHFFYGISDESVILKNLLKLYKSVLNDNSKQLCLFWGITLTKKISDIATKMIIDFIEQRLIVINPQFDIESIPSKMTFIDNKIKSIEWLGTQQELCELFLELIDKNWIPKIEEGERRNIAKAITTIFDLDNTKRNVKSNPLESFYQQFKGEMVDGERLYSFLDSNKYDRKFKTIEKNNR
jgi:hypothetical protein